MKEIYDFLKACPCYFIATMDGDQPRVRPFGTILLFEDKLYIQSRAGEHYQVESRHYPERNGAAVFPADVPGNIDNMKNNTLLKALKG